ncbi:hypothetical protein KW790_00045 [Candidatus Parcubacteria bacterium]|nr:hypothetical protein [Candidatus Parcubacteria bacterium]
MLTLRDLVKFSLLVAFFSILSDATLAHALLWENDPYWTYWITKTLLIGTVFSIGTAFFGIGALRGAIIATIHTLILSTYYWTFSPVGLPEKVQWLDLDHAWTTGLPIHFTVIYLGYLTALWFWKNNKPQVKERLVNTKSVWIILGATLVSVIVMGILSSLVLSQFVGVTWFVTRILVIFTSLLAITAYTPLRQSTVWLGGLILSLILTAYSHYLSPLGLPGTWRVFKDIVPSTSITWLNFQELWYYQFPVYLIVSLLLVWFVKRNRAVSM